MQLVDDLVAENKLATDYSLIHSIAEYLKITHYLDKYLELYNSDAFNKEDKNNGFKTIQVKSELILNVYELAMYSNFNDIQKKALFLAALAMDYNNRPMSKKIFSMVHDSFDKKMQIKENVYSLALMLFQSVKMRNKSQLVEVAVFLDANQLTVFSHNTDTILYWYESTFHKWYKRNSGYLAWPNFSQWLAKVNKDLETVYWFTGYGKIKAFNKNISITKPMIRDLIIDNPEYFTIRR